MVLQEGLFSENRDLAEHGYNESLKKLISKQKKIMFLLGFKAKQNQLQCGIYMLKRVFLLNLNSMILF
jgi:hypothetical protein